MGVIIFWGAGKIGKQMLELWQQFGVRPDFFADNSEEKWGTFYDGVKVLSVEELKSKTDAQILITCKQFENISDQLMGYGISGGNIFRGNTVYDMLVFWSLHMRENLRCDIVQEKKLNWENDSSFSVLFDVQSGFVLGGVEAWALQMADKLTEQGFKVKFLMTDLSGYAVSDTDERMIQLEYKNDISEVGRLLKCLKAIKNNLPCNMVCDFPFSNFLGACLAKMLWPQEVNLIAVVHSDEKVYYKRYSDMRYVIDHCLVTCDMMEEVFISNGMDKKQIKRLVWQIPCQETLERTYSGAGQPLRIGYAGRIVKTQKRMDLLAEIMKKLKNRNVDFRLEIAGTGEYEDELRKSLDDVLDRVNFAGQIAREQIPSFWEEQDIGINCSDLEGRCVSKAESMAAGAVPVITDTSSARDDVADGYNGYVVPIGDVDGIVDRICYLYQHRELLELMGKRAHQTILKQNASSDLIGMWDKILKR